MNRTIDRAGAWFLTGPLGRVVAFVVDLAVAWATWAAGSVRTKLRRP